MPDFNQGEYQVTIKATPGATLAETKERALQVVRRLKAMPDVDYTYTTIGEAGITRRPATEGVVYVKLKPTRGKTFSQVLDEARRAVADVPGLTYGFTEAGPFGQKPLQYSVRGPEVDELDRLSRELVQAMGKIRGVADVETSLEKSKPELRVEFDRDRAGDLGLNVAPVAMTLRAALTGEVATTIEDAAGDTHDVRVRLRADQRRYRRGPAGPARPDGQGRRLRGQDPRPARGGGEGGSRERPVHHPPQGPAARGAHLGRQVGAQPRRGRGRHRGRGRGDEAAAGLRRDAGRRLGGAEEDVPQHAPDPARSPSSSST